MKKSLAAILLVLLSSSVSASDWFGVQFGFDLGWADSVSVGYELKDTVYEDGDGPDVGRLRYVVNEDTAKLLFTSFDTRFWLWRTMFVGGGTTVLVNTYYPYLPGYFRPSFVSYRFDTGVRWQWFTLRYVHDCTHPQVGNAYAQSIDHLWGESSTNRIILETDFSIGAVPRR